MSVVGCLVCAQSSRYSITNGTHLVDDGHASKFGSHCYNVSSSSKGPNGKFHVDTWWSDLLDCQVDGQVRASIQCLVNLLYSDLYVDDLLRKLYSVAKVHQQRSLEIGTLPFADLLRRFCWDFCHAGIKSLHV